MRIGGRWRSATGPLAGRWCGARAGPAGAPGRCLRLWPGFRARAAPPPARRIRRLAAPSVRCLAARASCAGRARCVVAPPAVRPGPAQRRTGTAAHGHGGVRAGRPYRPAGRRRPIAHGVRAPRRTGAPRPCPTPHTKRRHGRKWTPRRVRAAVGTSYRGGCGRAWWGPRLARVSESGGDRTVRVGKKAETVVPRYGLFLSCWRRRLAFVRAVLDPTPGTRAARTRLLPCGPSPPARSFLCPPQLAPTAPTQHRATRITCPPRPRRPSRPDPVGHPRTALRPTGARASGRPDRADPSPSADRGATPA